MPDQYQNVIITLSDGRTGLFTGRVLVNNEDELLNVQVKRLSFTEARPLPEGTTFERLDEDAGISKSDAGPAATV